MAGAGERLSGAPLCEGKVEVLAQDAGPLLPTAARRSGRAHKIPLRPASSFCCGRKGGGRLRMCAGGAGSRCFLASFGAIFQEVAGLAVQLAADGLEGAEAYRLGLAGFQDGEVGRREVDALGQFAERDFALGHHDVEVYDNGHIFWVFMRFGFSDG